MLKELNILCIIPARGGSKGVPKKNIKLLGGRPLIDYSIETAKESKYINRIIVSTDSQEILEIVKSAGLETPFLRPKELSSDLSKDIDYIRHTVNYLKKEEFYIPDYIVLLRPTTPLRSSNIVDNAIEKLFYNKKATGLRSSHKVSEVPYKWFCIDNEFYKPICSEYSLEDTNRPRQSFPEVYLPNGYVDIILSNNIENNLFGDKILSFETNVSYEIDTIEDFEFIEFLLKKKEVKR